MDMSIYSQSTENTNNQESIMSKDSQSPPDSYFNQSTELQLVNATIPLSQLVISIRMVKCKRRLSAKLETISGEVILKTTQLVQLIDDCSKCKTTKPDHVHDILSWTKCHTLLNAMYGQPETDDQLLVFLEKWLSLTIATIYFVEGISGNLHKQMVARVMFREEEEEEEQIMMEESQKKHEQELLEDEYFLKRQTIESQANRSSKKIVSIQNRRESRNENINSRRSMKSQGSKISRSLANKKH